jgi:hypothetical protein
MPVAALAGVASANLVGAFTGATWTPAVGGTGTAGGNAPVAAAVREQPGATFVVVPGSYNGSSGGGGGAGGWEIIYLTTALSVG